MSEPPQAQDRKTHVATSRDHVHELAWRSGASVSEVWNDDNNRALRERGRTPAILAPGDVVHLPTQRSSRRVTPHTKNVYRAVIPVLRTRLRLIKDGALTPWANTKLRVRMGTSAPHDAATDKDGWVELDIPIVTSWIVMELVDQNVLLDLEVGGLDPVTTIDGIRMRLVLLGRYHGPMRGEADEILRAAIRTYQRHQSLEVTGEPDAPTRAKLLHEVGC